MATLSTPVSLEKNSEPVGSSITSRPPSIRPGLAWTSIVTPATARSRRMYQSQPAEATTTRQP